MDDDLPHNALIVKELLQSMGVENYDPRVLHQLLNFMYRYVSDVLQDADVFARHEGSSKKEIGLGDVMLAIQAREAASFVQPPSLDVLMEMAEVQNKQPLPEIPRRFGLRLPPDEDCLLAPNYILKPVPEAAATSLDASTGGAILVPTPGLSSQRGGSKQTNIHSFKFLPRQQPGHAPGPAPTSPVAVGEARGRPP
eukprot:jgi/Botrbrau1/8859/Bobra.50_2s0016.1